MRISCIFLIVIIGVLSSCQKAPDNSLSDELVQFNKDTAAIAGYLNEHSIAATKLLQGVWFVIDSAAQGIRPTFSDSIKLKYSMKLLTGNTVVDQSTTAKHFVLDSLLSGIQIALPEFGVGSRGRIFIPSYYGYGNIIRGSIPANSNLVFEFSLSDVKDYQLKLDTIAIDSYLSSHGITSFNKDISGLRYTIETLGTGARPSLTNQIQVNYTATTMSNSIVVDQGSSTVLKMSASILGWQIGMQMFPEGSSITLYIPSRLAYGPNGFTTNTTIIKPNEN